MIDREQNRVRNSARLDDSLTDRVASVFVAVDQPLLVEDVTHGEERLERVSLRASCRADIGLARRDSDAVVAYAANRFLGNSRTVVLDRNRAASRRDRKNDSRRNVGLLGGVERVVEQFLDDDKWPIPDIVAGLVLQ